MKVRSTALLPFSVMVAIAGPVAAQTYADDDPTAFDGLYRPAGSSGAGWTCDTAFIGMDGGALAIRDGYLEGFENRCELTQPTPSGF